MGPPPPIKEVVHAPSFVSPILALRFRFYSGAYFLFLTILLCPASIPSECSFVFLTQLSSGCGFLYDHIPLRFPPVTTRFIFGPLPRMALYFWQPVPDTSIFSDRFVSFLPSLIFAHVYFPLQSSPFFFFVETPANFFFRFLTFWPFFTPNAVCLPCYCHVPPSLPPIRRRTHRG